MSLFNKNNTPGADDDRLKQWGDAERAATPTRRGRFAGIVDRLMQSTAATETAKPSLFPAFAVAGVTLAAVSVTYLNAPQPPTTTAAPTVAAARKEPAVQHRGGLTPLRQRGGNDNFTHYTGDLSVRCDPVFISGDTYRATTGSRNSATVPFAITIQNGAKAFAGEIVVSVDTQGAAKRVYTYPVTVPGDGATFHTTVYPEMGRKWARSRCEISLRTPTRTITLDGGEIISRGDTGDFSAVAILDTRLGVLSGRGQQKAGYLHRIYAKPRNAPDRAIGYDAVDVLVLGYGCETLSTAQWAAIREWVKDGGSLVLFGGSEKMRRALNAPAALALSPAESFATETRTVTPHLQVSHFDAHPLKNGFFNYDFDLTRLFPQTMTTAPRLKTDALIVFKSPMQGGAEWATIGARRTLGAGSVAFYGFDPTVPVFRNQAATLSKWWGDVSQYNRGAVSAVRLDRIGSSPWNSDTDNFAATHNIKNPFYTHLPDLKLVMYVFLGYFVLVIPVSFVVLKQTRRMHYAWFTGPTLALLCAGGFAVSTRDLYSAPQSVRTSGIVALDAGDGAARFHGVSELYAPRAGRFALDLPGTQQVFGKKPEYDSGGEPSLVTQTTDTGTGENAPTVDMPNLSFRRVEHSQTMTLGAGITAALRALPSGDMTGTLTNSTGQTLNSVTITLRGDRSASFNDATYVPIWQFSAEQFAPGSQKITLTPHMRINNMQTSDTVELFGGTVRSLTPRTPFLTARISGETFAPKRFGQWVGGDKSVRVVAKLPAVPLTGMPRYATTANNKDPKWRATQWYPEPPYRFFTGATVQGGAK